MRIPKQGDRAVVANAGFGVGTGDKLVKNGERVAYGAAAGTDDELKHTGFDGHVLFAAELFEVGQKNFGRYQPERVVVGTRADGSENLIWLCGGEDEFDVLGRFFHDFEQGVEPFAGDHVCFVDDEDFVAVAHGCEGCTFTQVAGVVYAAVGCRIHFDDVEGAAAVAGEFAAGVAYAAGGGGWSLGTVEAACQDSCGGGFAASARA